MKKNPLYLMMASALIFSFSACGDNDEPSVQKVAAITVLAPDDLEEFDLNYQQPDKNFSFEWSQATDGTTYQLLISLNEDLSSAKAIDITDGKYTTTHKGLDDLLKELGVGIYKRGDLYWCIEGTKGTEKGRSEIRTMRLFRFYNPFTDPRDGEVYRVCRTVDPLTGEYSVWLADNIRAKKYSDGTPLTLDVDVHFCDLDGGAASSEWDKLRGGYYTWTAAMRGDKGAALGEKIQGIAPTGWHIATKPEWDFLINCQGTEPSKKLGIPAFWDPNAKIVRTNEIGFNMVSTGHMWTPAHTVGEQTILAFFWTATAPAVGDIYPWNPSEADYPKQAVSYAFNANDEGAALYPYDRTRAFTVRCVLD